jgi:hypothetical protein
MARPRKSSCFWLTRLASAFPVGALLAGAVASCSGGGSSTASDAGQPPQDGGGAPSDGRADSNGAMGDDASDDAPLDGAACPLPPEAPAPNCFTSFAQIGPTVVTTDCVGGPLPRPQGGSIPDGIYRLQNRAMYGSSCPTSLDMEGTLVICPRQWDWVLVYDPLAEGGTVPGFYAYNYAAAFRPGASVVLTPKCTSDLDTVVDTLSYTFAAGQLQLISAKANIVSTYVKM